MGKIEFLDPTVIDDQMWLLCSTNDQATYATTRKFKFGLDLFDNHGVNFEA